MIATYIYHDTTHMIFTRNSLLTVLSFLIVGNCLHKGEKILFVKFVFSSISRQKLIALLQLFTHVFNNNTSFPFLSSVFSIVCGMIVILSSIFKQYTDLNQGFLTVKYKRYQFALETPHASKTFPCCVKNLPIVAPSPSPSQYTLTLTALLL